MKKYEKLTQKALPGNSPPVLPVHQRAFTWQTAGLIQILSPIWEHLCLLLSVFSDFRLWFSSFVLDLHRYGQRKCLT